jgi:pilus assembly protein FimV
MAVAFALLPMRAHAIGLGTIEVKSRLDQPFVAEIPLTLNDPSEANDLVVRLASPEAFARVGLDRSVQVGANLTFTLGRNERGEQVIRVTTPQKMRDPYVSFLLEADWGKGKMVREYTALLDPPHTVSVPHRPINAPQVAVTPMPAQPPAVAPPVTSAIAPPPSIAAGPPPAAQPEPQPQRPEPLPQINAAVAPPPPAPVVVAPQPVPPSPVAIAPPEPPPAAVAQPPAALQPPATPPPEPSPAATAQPEPAPAASQSAPTPAPAPAAETAAASATPDSVTVEKGDTLSQIAGNVRPSDVSVNRMMIALQRANPDAFIHSNINLLRSGAVLRIPGSTDTQALSAAEADALVHEQVESWRQMEQSAPSLQPQEGAETTVAKAAKPTEPSAAGPTPAAEKPAKPAAETAKPAEVAAESSAPKPETVAGAGHRKPRGARLEIVPPIGNAARGSQSGASEGGSGSELRAQLTQAKEELAARNSEVSDLKSRVADLEKIQKDSQQLLTMKDSQLAALQQKLAELAKQKNAVAPSPNASAALAAATAAPAANATAAAAASVMKPSAASAPAISPSKPMTAPAKHPVAATAEPADQTPWFLQAWSLIGMTSVVLAGLLFLMLRRPKSADPSAPTRKYALAESLAAIQNPAAKVAGKPESDPAVPVPSPAVTGRSTVSEPLPPARPQVSKPYWTGTAAATVAPAAVAAPSPDPAPVASTVVPAPVTAPSAPAATQAKDDWAIDEPPAQPLPASQVITKEHPVVPELDDPNQTVATKLELARAYIDIGDHDGARGMLEEVLIEGNGSQQEEAFKLLETLDS